VKKACDIDQHGAPPMDGSKEDDQAGYTENPYWGAAKKACGIDQYRAPPMDESKDNQGGGLMTAAVAPTTGIARAVVSTVTKGGLVRRWGCVAMPMGRPGWGRAAIVALMAVPTGR
jgi:hypothetical protein